MLVGVIFYVTSVLTLRKHVSRGYKNYWENQRHKTTSGFFAKPSLFLGFSETAEIKRGSRKPPVITRGFPKPLENN